MIGGFQLQCTDKQAVALKILPINDNVLENRENLMEWGVKAHNLVNKENNKKEYSTQDGIKNIIEQTPSELITDVMKSGINITGGGALLEGIDKRIANATNFPVKVSPEPKRSVIRGIATIIENKNILKILEASMQLKEVSKKISIN